MVWRGETYGLSAQKVWFWAAKGMVLSCAGREAALSELLSHCPNGFCEDEKVREGGAVFLFSQTFFGYFCFN